MFFLALLALLVCTTGVALDSDVLVYSGMSLCIYAVLRSVSQTWLLVFGKRMPWTRGHK